MRSRWTYAFIVTIVAGILSLDWTLKIPETQLSLTTAEANKVELPIIKPGDPIPANAFIELAKLVNPAVVNISTSVRPKRQGRDPLFEMLEQFYGLRTMPRMQKPATALGTGFIIKEDGLIITNNHVIDGADEISVQLNDSSDKKYEAEVIGSDDRTDIALIKIKGKGFPTVKFGASKDTEVGEWVAAFGNPFGNGHTMTKGIISAKGRDISEINRFPLMQTDAPINPGNSGGPLVNLKGEVIGVNSAIDARAQGIGFAIPIDEVKSILPQLEKNEKIKKGYIGVTLRDLSPQEQMALNMESAEGAFIASVEDDGPAAKAGIRSYDLITDFNGKKIKDSSDLGRAVADTTVGTKVKAKILREGKEKALEVTVAERTDSRMRKALQRGKNQFGEAAPNDLGFMVADINESLVREFELPADVKRPVIVRVEEGSQAARAGLLPGDLILDVNRKEVTTTAAFFKNLKKGTNTVRIFREGAVIFILLKN